MRAQVGGLSVFLLSGGLFLFVGHNVQSLRQLQSLIWVFIVVGAFQVGLMVFDKDFSLSSLAVTNVGTVGSLFWVWLVAVSFSQALVNDDLPRLARFAAFGVGVFALAWTIRLAQTWVSGWLPSLVALGVVILIRFPRITAGAGLLLAAPALAVAGRAADAVLSAESYSWDTRLEAWRVMFKVIANNPLLGFGPANYHFYTPLFPFLGYPAMFNSHNNYIDLLAQTGVIGLLAFCWFAIEALRLAWNLFAHATDGFVRAYVAGAFGGIVASLLAGVLADWVVPFTYNIGLKGFRSSLLFWFFVGGLLALKRMPHLQGARMQPLATRRF
jgi:O-antigen ligase